jgi:tetratricopeptide (TPR) repeat protein
LHSKHFAVALLMGLVAAASPSRAAGQQDQLDALMDQLHQTGTAWSNEVNKPAGQYNNATATQLAAQAQEIRKRIIAFVRTMTAKPPLPADFNEVFGKASYQFKNAKDWQDYFAAAGTFGEAAELAPWLPDVYFNMGLAQEKMHAYGEAIESYGFYLLAAPNAADAKQVEQKIGGLKYADQHKDEEFAADFLSLNRDQFWGAYEVWACDNCVSNDYFNHTNSNPLVADQFAVTAVGGSLDVTDTNTGTVWFRGKPRCLSYRMCFDWDWSDARSGRPIGGLIGKNACGGRSFWVVSLTLDGTDPRKGGPHSYREISKAVSGCN